MVTEQTKQNWRRVTEFLAGKMLPAAVLLVGIVGLERLTGCIADAMRAPVPDDCPWYDPCRASAIAVGVLRWVFAGALVLSVVRFVVYPILKGFGKSAVGAVSDDPLPNAKGQVHNGSA